MIRLSLRHNLLACFALATGAFADPMPERLADALAQFHAEGTKGWSFTQTTVAEGKSMVERYDASKFDFQRWSLLQKDGRAPTADEFKEYSDMLSRHTKGETAPNVKDQIRPDTWTLVSESPEEALYRFKIKPGGEDDRSAEHLAVTFTLHKPTGVIRHVELASIEPFSPMFSVKIASVRTAIDYTLPKDGEPTHLEKITVSVRGRAMLLKSLDQDMTVTYSDFAPAFPKPAKTDAKE